MTSEDVVSFLLLNAAEEAPPYEVIWDLNESFPDLPEDIKLSELTRAAVRLLEDRRIQLYRVSDNGTIEVLPPFEAQATAVQPSTWTGRLANSNDVYLSLAQRLWQAGCVRHIGKQ